MYIQFYTNTDPENPTTVAFRTADISSVEHGSRKVTVVMNTGMAYTQEYASIDLAEAGYKQILKAMEADGVTDTGCKEPVEVTTCKALLKHLDEFPECGNAGSRYYCDAEIVIQINDSRYELYDHPVLIQGLQSTIRELLEDLTS
jgi:hypothetical protein